MHAQSQETQAISPQPDRRNYDMDDDAADLTRWSTLSPVLKVLQEVIYPIYLATDAAAIRQQKRHSQLVLWAAVCGTLAVLCAIFELSEIVPISRATLSIIELIAAIIAIVVVGLGIYSALHPDWLLQRFLAEQCRFIKFQLLLNPGAWYKSKPEEIRAQVERTAALLSEPSTHMIHEWVTWRKRIADRFDALPADIPADLLRDLIDYYEVKRLRGQQQYFQKQADKRHRWEIWTRHVSPNCFYLSILCAFVHFLLEWLGSAGEHEEGGHRTWLHFFALVFVLLASVLPVLAMGVRTYRAAHEFGRNKLRFEGMSQFLSDTLRLLEKQEPPATTIPLLREAEIAMDSEHRAWLRLMIEAEWFG